ncbi:MAG: SIS domain-containing protein [Thomasclavelia spiroformis]
MVNEQLFQAAQSNKDHCAILISYSGETNEVIAAAELLKRRKVPMIAITSFGESRLSKLCDYVLFLDLENEFIQKFLLLVQRFPSISCLILSIAAYLLDTMMKI